MRDEPPLRVLAVAPAAACRAKEQPGSRTGETYTGWLSAAAGEEADMAASRITHSRGSGASGTSALSRLMVDAVGATTWRTKRGSAEIALLRHPWRTVRGWRMHNPPSAPPPPPPPLSLLPPHTSRGSHASCRIQSTVWSPKSEHLKTQNQHHIYASLLPTFPWNDARPR